ncbi:MAG: glycosyltransferase family 2 protein, partial [Clostridium butyricum]|nr:glycosyltransferase family 2 protein [Clostridium butyricum]
MKKLTIITVCFNSEQTIERCLQSVIKQLNEEIEYIIIDGKSTDNTVNIIKSFNVDKKIYLISENDNGIYDAMNKGIMLSKGEWVYFLNSDDCLKPNILNKILNYIEKSKCDCLYGNIEENFEFNNNIYFREINSNKELSNLKKGMIIPHPGFFCKTNIIKRVGLFDTKFRIAADWDLVLRIYLQGYKFIYIDEVISEFYLGGACSASHNVERHKIRKKNNLYKFLDIYYVKDIYYEYKKNILYKKLN